MTRGSLPRPVTSPNHSYKTARIKQRRPRYDGWGVQERSDRQERVRQRDVAVENKVSLFNWRTTSNSGWDRRLHKSNSFIETLTPSSRSFSRCLCQPQLLSAVLARWVKTYLRATIKTELATLSSCSNAHVQRQRLTGRPCLGVLRQEEQDAKLRLPIKLDLWYLAGHSGQYNSL